VPVVDLKKALPANYHCVFFNAVAQAEEASTVSDTGNTEPPSELPPSFLIPPQLIKE
jgi:hypothetical protein